MDKDKIINDILSLIEEIRGKDELIETKYYLTNGWYLEVERFPPDGEQREEIYFDATNKNVHTDDWEHDQWTGGYDSEDTIRGIIEFMFNFAEHY